jgi:hypothetical protein
MPIATSHKFLRLPQNLTITEGIKALRPRRLTIALPYAGSTLRLSAFSIQRRYNVAILWRYETSVAVYG